MHSIKEMWINRSQIGKTLGIVMAVNSNVSQLLDAVNWQKVNPLGLSSSSSLLGHDGLCWNAEYTFSKTKRYVKD